MDAISKDHFYLLLEFFSLAKLPTEKEIQLPSQVKSKIAAITKQKPGRKKNATKKVLSKEGSDDDAMEIEEDIFQEDEEEDIRKELAMD